MIRVALFLAAACVAALGPGRTSAQSMVSTGGSFVSADLVAGVPDHGGARIAGLVLDMVPGWKTYWRAPGEAGVPPRFDWSGSENLAGVEVLWPRPEIFESFGMQTVGYSGRVVLPLVVTPGDPAAPVVLRLDLSLGVCKEVCIFEERALGVEMIADAREGEALVTRALSAVPPPAAKVGLVSVDCQLEGRGETRRFTANLAFETPVADPVVLVEGRGALWFSGAQTRANGESILVEADATVPEDIRWFARDQVRMTVLGSDGFAADLDGCSTGR